ncbi:hypothetical protein BrevBR_16170 [Brevundimonas sp. BR2-1]|uniref:hypothetical protein n=1 Tax=Brevundimonas sp. BR2-1 TaxID=3031123 RepID=UPI00309ED6C0
MMRMTAPSKAGKRLYVASLQGGNSHPEWSSFYHNVSHLNGKSPDYGGINNVAVFSSHHDPATALFLCREDLTDEKSVEVHEITAATLLSDHWFYRQLVQDYFLPHGTYPAIGKSLPE